MRLATCILANPEATARTIRLQLEGVSPGSHSGVIPGWLRYPLPPALPGMFRASPRVSYAS